MRTPSRIFVLVLASAALAVTACASSAKPMQAGQIANAASRGPSATTSPSTDSDQVLGPFGLGVLHLGMSAAQVRATGLVDAFTSPTKANGCAFVPFKAAPKDTGSVVISPDLGLVAINAWGTIATADGLKIGDSYATVHSIYPNWKAIDGQKGHGLVATPGNPGARYRIDVADNGNVRALTLQSINQDCYE